MPPEPSPPAASHPAAPLQRAPGGVGVLLVNLGSPAAAETSAVRRYLREFLSDRRVIEVWRPLWLFILNAFVLTTRPKKSAHAYRQIWNHERNEAPLIAITRAQAEKLGQRLGPDVRVDWAMRYGAPSIAARLQAMQDAGCDRILVAALYPQYSATTMGTANDAAFAALMKMRRQPALRTLPEYHDDPRYIAALAQSVRDALAALPFTPDVVLASYHGLPQDYVDKGDPYYRQCMETTRLLGEALGWNGERLRAVFQSRFGKGEWLKPYTDVTIRELAEQGTRRLAVVMPGFSADCLETLEEIAIRGRDAFLAAGGRDFAAIPCLNDSEAGMDVIEAAVRRELSGWPGAGGGNAA
jgi:ferrochelatase